jgi:D-arabinose 5-phosphate isomerase GutQ
MVQQISQQRPVQNSEVYVLRQVPPFPPLSPPSPITPAEDFDGAPIDARSLTQPDITVCAKKLAIEERLSRAVHVIATEAAALQSLTHLYSSDRCARDGFTRAVDTIISRHGNNGKLVVIGVGKSGHIAKKLVATFNSFAITAVFLHPTEALHGDLGQISRHDTLLMITFSGKTPELLTLLPHLDKSLPLILLTSHVRPETCDLVRHRPDTILLPAPVHEAETASFGVAAPTTSTTVALAVGDALAVVVSRELYPSVTSVFSRNHPGGAIGAAFCQQQQPPVTQPQQSLPILNLPPTIRTLMVPLDAISTLPPSTPSLTGLDVLRAGYASPSGWVWVNNLPSTPTTTTATSNSDTNNGGGVVSPRRIRRMGTADMARTLKEEARWLVTPRRAFLSIAADTTVRAAAEWVDGLRAAAAGKDIRGAVEVGGDKEGEGQDEDGLYGDEAVVAVMEKGECVGLLEAGTLFEET